MADFAADLEKINALVDKHEGFVWRLKGEGDNATAIKVFEDDFLIINMSVWKNMKSLSDYVHKSMHLEILKCKTEGFEKMNTMHFAFWQIDEYHTPIPIEAKERLEFLQVNWDSDFAFGFKKKI